MKTTIVFAKNQRAQTQTIINRGGARSSKSHSISQLLTLRFLEGKSQKILILRKTLPSLRLSVLPMLKDIWSDLGILSYIKEDKQNLDYRINRNWIHCGSLDDVEKIKSSEWNAIWMEEANEFSHLDYQILKLRLSAKPKDQWRNQIFLSFNPVDEYSWIKTQLIDTKSPNIVEITSNYKDNPFLSKEYIDTLLALESQDQNFFRIYTLGLWGKLENLVYSNWSEIDDFPEIENCCYALDFGFTQPTCLLKLYFIEDVVYVRELLYQAGLTNTDLIAKLPLLIPNKDIDIWADSEDPARIEEILQSGYNVRGVEKHPFSVKSGVNTVKTKKIFISKDSPNVLKEIRGYSYRKDKSGRILDEPVKWNDHAMDCLRYGVVNHYAGNEPRIRWI